MAAIANLPIGCLFEDPRRDQDDLVLRVTSPDGDEIEVGGATARKPGGRWPNRWLHWVKGG